MASHVRQPLSSSLAEITRRPRQFGFLLAALILATIADQSLYLYGWILFLLVYPLLISSLLPFFRIVRNAMLVDGFMTGMLISLVNFNLEVSVVLLALLSISSLIVGNLACLLPVLLATAIGTVCGHILHPDSFVGGESFYLVSFVSLIAYVVFIGIMVFDETKRLKREHRNARLATRELENFKRWIAPFVPEPIRRDIANQRPVRKRITVFFCDISGFTRLMDSMDEALVARFLNDYFTEMTGIAHGFGGTLDKFIGDGIMIFFGDSCSKGAARDAEASVAMALDMRDCFRELATHWQSEHGGEVLKLRIGIHSGYALVGDFGCAERREYTALGSAVNLASRLESVAHPDEILVSGETLRLIDPLIRVSPRGFLTLRGFSKPVPAWSVLGLSTHSIDAQFRLLG